jgi:hypothetical protein
MDSHGFGRWSCVRINGKDGREVQIVAACQACKASIGINGKNGCKVQIVAACQACKASVGTIGSKTACAAQRWHLLRQAGDQKPNMGKSFIADLDAFLAPCHADGAEIPLMGDFNKTPGNSWQELLEAIINKHSLLDLSRVTMDWTKKWKHFPAAQKDWTMHLARKSLLSAESITHVGVTPCNFVIASDHC